MINYEKSEKLSDWCQICPFFSDSWGVNALYFVFISKIITQGTKYEKEKHILTD